MDVGEFIGRRLYTGLRLDYRLRLWAPTSASRSISAVAEVLVFLIQASLLADQTYGSTINCLRRKIWLCLNKNTLASGGLRPPEFIPGLFFWGLDPIGTFVL